MNRAIKFRGKSIYGDEWLYGSPLKIEEERYAVIPPLNDIEIGKSISMYEVYLETIGQFTGLLDRNSKEIYEGDIVQLDYITTTGKHRIGLSFEVKWCTQEGCWVGWDGFVENSLQQTRKMFVVKGNVQDNPELINE